MNANVITQWQIQGAAMVLAETPSERALSPY